MQMQNSRADIFDRTENRLVRLGLLFAAAALFALALILLRGIYATQTQYKAASEMATTMRLYGADTTLGSFEDGYEPDGCAVIAKRTDNQRVLVNINPDGTVKDITYAVVIENLSAPDLAAVNTSLRSLANLVERTEPTFNATPEQLALTTKQITKGIKTSKQQGKRFEIGEDRYEIVYDFDNFQTYMWLSAKVRPVTTIQKG